MSVVKIVYFVSLIVLINGHAIGDKHYMVELKKLCDHAYNCFHDLILVCGKSVREPRTFFDLCDLYEYSCENNMVFTHVRDEPDNTCPNPNAVVYGR